MLLPLLFLPLAAPILIAAVEGTIQITEGGSWSAASQWLQVLGAFDAIFVVGSLLTFQFVLED